MGFFKKDKIAEEVFQDAKELSKAFQKKQFTKTEIICMMQQYHILKSKETINQTTDK